MCSFAKYCGSVGMNACSLFSLKFIHSTILNVEDTVLYNTDFLLTVNNIMNQLIYFFLLVGPSFDPDSNDSRVEPATDLYNSKAT